MAEHLRNSIQITRPGSTCDTFEPIGFVHLSDDIRRCPNLISQKSERVSFRGICGICDRVKAASATSSPTVVAVSKYKPVSDVLACLEHAEQRTYEENQVQELVDKAKQESCFRLSKILRHFRTFQSNKSKTLVGRFNFDLPWLAIPSLHTIQTLTSTKAPEQGALRSGRCAKETQRTHSSKHSGEENKSWLPPLISVDATLTSTDAADVHELELVKFATHVVEHYPFLRLQGLMTIGSIEQSIHAKEGEENHDFKTLLVTQNSLQGVLRARFPDKTFAYGENGRLLVSMGMSADFEAALRAGSDIVRVGTGIFGGRRTKEEVKGGATASCDETSKMGEKRTRGLRFLGGLAKKKVRKGEKKTGRRRPSWCADPQRRPDM
ncbi:hypothetical protein EV122DRAFT_221179 [Schizophyllum commune]